MKCGKAHNQIDLIITWVDGSDPDWLAEKASALGFETDNNEVRYRDWGNLKYLFRGVEKNLPWIRKVHFVTWGHLPEWLNVNAGKINVVKHKDFIPEEYLPTFNSHTIEHNLHRIEGLSEYFIYANDDTFFIKPMEESDFFQKDLPVDSAILGTFQFCHHDDINKISVNNMVCLNSNFDKRKCIISNLDKWYSWKYGLKGLVNNLYLYPLKRFSAIQDYHLPSAFMKSTWYELWQKEYAELDNTCRHKIRSTEDISQWLFRYWQYAKGCFMPASPDRGKYLEIGTDSHLFKEIVNGGRYKMVCLNDVSMKIDFEKEKSLINSVFEELFPEKSSFEV